MNSLSSYDDHILHTMCSQPDMSKMNLLPQDPNKAFDHFATELVGVLKRVLGFCKHLLGIQCRKFFILIQVLLLGRTSICLVY